MITDALLRIFEKDPTIKRHLLKTISWRIVGSIDTALIGWLISGNLRIGATIGGFEMLTKMFLYFFHERIWHKIKFGVPSRVKLAENVKKENAPNLFHQISKISRQEREQLNNNKSFTIWLTGLSASGKSSIASELDSWFYKNGLRSYVIDGDNTRLGINSDLTFSKEDRSENIRRVAQICRLFNEAGTIVVASFISPFEDDRKKAEVIIGREHFIETFIDASLQTCKARDIKGLYKLAEEGKLKNFTGIDSPYERPISPTIQINTDSDTVENCGKKVIRFLLENNKVVIEKTTLEIAEV